MNSNFYDIFLWNKYIFKFANNIGYHVDDNDYFLRNPVTPLFHQHNATIKKILTEEMEFKNTVSV